MCSCDMMSSFAFLQFHSCRVCVVAVVAFVGGKEEMGITWCCGVSNAESLWLNTIIRAAMENNKCISRESSPGHIDGNDVFCH